jgi:hypothetical protein
LRLRVQRLTLNNFKFQIFKGRSKRDGLFLLPSIRQKGPVDLFKCNLGKQKRRGILGFEVEEYIKLSQEKK